MAYRLKISTRALREIAGAHEWYEHQIAGLGNVFMSRLESQLQRIEQAPLQYTEVAPGIRRALLPKFPYGVFYTVKADLIHVLAVLHEASSSVKWPD